MATRTQSRSSNRTTVVPQPSRQFDAQQPESERSAFSWGDGAGPMLGAALGRRRDRLSPPITAASS